MGKKLEWGLLSTAKINKALFAPLKASGRNTLRAVASRDANRAADYARKNKIPKWHGSYEELLADPAIDIIYNSLPNHLHMEWTVKAVQAGKHVLCEKPLALSVQEVDSISSAAAHHNRVVVEALMYRSHALTCKVREIIQAGKLGKVSLVRGSFSYHGTGPDDYRLKKEMGGGALWDVGIYPLGYTRHVLGTEPLEVFGWETRSSTGVDESFAAQLRFPGDVYLQMDCSMARPYHVFMEFIGDEATLVVPQPFNPTPKESLYLTRKGLTQTIQVKGTGTYVGEVESMADAVLSGTAPAVSLADSRATVEIVQALFESASLGKPVQLPPDTRS